MKTTAFSLLLTSSLVAITKAAPSASSSYKLSILSQEPNLNGSAVVVKDESTANTFPNALGSFSTRNPRHPYTFTIATVSAKDNLYELKSAVAQKHLVLNGDPIAPQLFEVPVGGDPAPVPGKTITRTKFLVLDEPGRMMLEGAEDTPNASGEFDGPGSWRACNQGTVDYQLYWFDGRSNLTALLGDCKSVRLVLDAVKPSTSSSVAPATTLVTSGFITGVPAPATTTSTTTATTTTCAPSATTTSPAANTSAPLVTIRIFNDQTGASAEASVPADGASRSVPDLFRGSAIDARGDIIGTSAQLVRFSDSTACALTNLNVRDWVVELDGRARNFVDLDGDVARAVPVWLGGFTFQCRRA